MDRDLSIWARGLGRRFGRRWALAHVDLEAAPGEALLLAGPNGSGKTTLLRILAGLSRPTVGEVRLFGLDPRQDRLAYRRSVTMVTHQTFLYDRLTALEMLQIWARLLASSEPTASLVAMLDEVGLAARRDTLIGEFSEGMRKRLTLLRTRLERPRLVLLDEPFAALDPEGQDLIEAWIGRFIEQGTGVVMASHAVARSSRLCRRAFLLDQGQFAWQGPAAALPQRLEATA